MPSRLINLPLASGWVHSIQDRVRVPRTSIALTAALLPLIAVNLCYALSATLGFVPTCLTYLDGCTSISASGRHGLSYWLFKIAMLPQSAVLIAFWLHFEAFATHTAPGAARAARRARILGIVGAAFLIVYTIFLGADNHIYRLMRRYGVFVYFIATFVAMGYASQVLWRYRQRHSVGRWAGAAIGICLVLLLLALAEAPLGQFGLGHDRAENVIEWNFSLLMQFWFIAVWRVWLRARPHN